jgi:hypothetical protein
MSRSLRLAAAISLAAILGLMITARAQQEPTKRPPVQGQNHPPGPPGQHLPGPAAHPGTMPQAFHPPGPGPRGAPPGPHVIHAPGERGYSFSGPGGVRRQIATFSPREREIWFGGGWHHEMRFGAPTFVSEVEFMDDGLGPGAPPAVVGAPVPAVAGPASAVVVAPPPVVVAGPPPPPVVCLGPLCVR